MKLQDVIQNALTDAGFAQELKDKAMLGYRAGTGTDEWEAFMAYFAEDSQQLAKFRTLTQSDEGCTDTMTLTLTVTSTVPCTLTTTSLTGSFFCG